MARKRNRETWKIDLALALKEVRNASKRSALVPEGHTASNYGIVRNTGKLMKGVDANFTRATAEFGWLKRARPFEGGREGYFWTGPPKMMYGKQLGKIIAIRDRIADEYEAAAKKRRAEEEAESARAAILKPLTDLADPAERTFPAKGSSSVVPDNRPKVKILGVWTVMPRMVEAASALKALEAGNFEVPDELREFCDTYDVTSDMELQGEDDLMSFLIEPCVKQLDAKGEVFSVDFRRLAEERPDVEHLVIKVGSAIK